MRQILNRAMDINMKLMKLSFFLVIFFIVCGQRLFGCNVPVFRYALERWPADNYEVYVFHRGELSPDHNAVMAWLKENSVSSVYYSNCTVTTVDIEENKSEQLDEMLKDFETERYPMLAVFYPRSTGISKIVWHGDLTHENARMIVDSPVRQDVAKRLLGGDASVFVLLESGNTEADNAAADTLEACLARAAEELRLPEELLQTPGFGEEIPIKFSMIRVSRSASGESPYISMLMNSEQDLADYANFPIAFPMYGRGRILFALLGEGISEQNILRSCMFLTGPCSCEIKAWNPGLDLLMYVDWDAGIYESWTANIGLPPIAGLAEPGRSDSNAAMASNNPTSDPVSSSSSSLTIKSKDSKLLRNVIITLGAVLLAVATLSVTIGIRRRYNNR